MPRSLNSFTLMVLPLIVLSSGRRVFDARGLPGDSPHLKEAFGLEYKSLEPGIFMMMQEESEQLDFRAVILMKNDMLALVGMATTPEGARVARFDPRSEPPVSLGPFEDPPKVAYAFRRSVRTSKTNGWTVIYDGPPLIG